MSKSKFRQLKVVTGVNFPWLESGWIAGWSMLMSWNILLECRDSFWSRHVRKSFDFVLSWLRFGYHSAYSLRRWPGKHWKPNPSSFINMSSLRVGVKLCWLNRIRFRWESCKGDYALSRITGSHFSFQFFAGFPECCQALVAVLIILFTLQFAKLQREKDERLARHGAENCRPLRRFTSEILGHAQLNIANQVSWELVTSHVKKWRCHVLLTDEHPCVL